MLNVDIRQLGRQHLSYLSTGRLDKEGAQAAWLYGIALKIEQFNYSDIACLLAFNGDY